MNASSPLNFTVLGSGNGARAFCGQIARKGYPVVMYEPLEETADYLKLKQEKEIFLTGDVSAGGKLQGVTMDIGTAVSGADVIFIVVPSFAHPILFQRMIPHLGGGQHVIIVPDNFGSFLLKKMITAAGGRPRVTISGTSSLPYACRIADYNTVMIYKKKFRMKVASSPAEDNAVVVDIMNDVFSETVEFFAGSNLLEIDLDNINFTLHPLPVLLNFGAIERHPDTFRHYVDGLTPMISELMAKMDRERLEVGAAWGLDLMPTLEQLKMYYGRNEARSYYEYVNSAESPYKDIVGHSVRSRYITEDVPCSLVPTLELARLAGIEMPVTRLCVELSSQLHGTDYAREGTTLEKLGLTGKTREQILEMAA